MQFDLTFEGNVADYPELRKTPSGKSVARLRVGHNTRRRNSRGEWVNGDTIWFTVTCWDRLAENIVDSIRLGDTVTVTARNDLSIFAYTNQSTGNPSGELQVTATNISLSMRFDSAESHRRPKQAEYSSDPWASAAPYENAYAEVVAEAAAEARAAAQAQPVPDQHAEDEGGSPAHEMAPAGDEPTEPVTAPDIDEPAEYDPELAAAALVG
jgi:single-strand DNA-binding protein